MVKEQNYNHYFLKNINFKLKEGEIVALVGPNGSGKTTFIESCTGIIPFKNGLDVWNNIGACSHFIFN